MTGRRIVTTEWRNDVDQWRRSMRTVNQDLDGTGKSFSKFASGAKAAIGGVVAREVADLARNMQRHGGVIQAVNRRTDQVFDDSAAGVRAWAASNNEAFGLSENGVLNLASAMGDLLVPMGFQRDLAAAMTKENLEVANALSVWTGGQVSAEKAATAITKAMLNEREMLKELGVAIRQADVDQRLLEKGQQALTGEARKMAEAVATQEIIFERSKDAIDSYREGMDPAIESQRRAAAAAADLKDQFAVQLLPALTSAVSAAGDLAKGAEVLLDWFGSLPEPAKRTALAITGIAAAVKLATANPLIAGLALLTGAVIKLGEGARKSEESIDRLTTALEAASDREFLGWLRDRGNELTDFDESMRELGVSIRDVITAVSGTDDDFAAFNQHLTDTTAGGGDALNFMFEFRDAVAALRDEYKASERTVREQEVAAKAAFLAQQRLADETEKDYQTRYRERTRRAAASTQDLADSARNAADGLALSREEAQRNVDPLFNLFAASRDLADATQRVNTLRDRQLEGTPQYVEAVIAMAEANVAYKSAQDAANTSTGDGEAAFRQLLESAGFAAEEIDNVIASLKAYNETPVRRHSIAVQTNTGSATVNGQRVPQAGSGTITPGHGGVTEFDLGGVIGGGRRGDPVLIGAHVGETILDTHRKPLEQFLPGADASLPLEDRMSSLAASVERLSNTLPGKVDIGVFLDGERLTRSIESPMVRRIRVKTGIRD